MRSLKPSKSFLALSCRALVICGSWNKQGFGKLLFASALVESRMGAVAWGLWPTPRFPSPLIKPDVPISGIRLSGWLHREARDGAARGRRWRHRTPRPRCMTSNVNRRLRGPLLLLPRPTPAVTTACCDAEAATLVHDGSPPVTANSPFRRAVPTTPADRVGARVDYFPTRAAFPT